MIIVSDLPKPRNLKADEDLELLLRGKDVNDADIKNAIRTDEFKGIALSKANKTTSINVADEIVDMRTKPQGENMVKTATKRHVSLKFGVVGTGQAGGRLAEVFYKFGYEVCAINTASQDLEYLDISADRKYLINNKELGGAGRDLDIGAACVEEHETQIRAFINEKLVDAEALILATSTGGGSGAGSVEILINLLSELGKPLIVIAVLPGAFDDSQSKHNSIVTLDRLANFASTDKINSLVLVDNANIELAFPNLSQAEFWKTANNAVVEPLHAFNSVSAMPTNYDALDSMDFAKSLIEAGNCVVFGTNRVPPELYLSDETALMGAIIEGLDKGLLAGGFDLKEAQTVGVLITARQSVLEKIPFTSIAYVFKYIADEYNSAKSFKGVYALAEDSDDITVRFIFSGMGLPKERVESLKNEAKKHMDILEEKKKNTKMAVGLGKDKATNQADQMINRMKKKNSVMGKLMTATKKVDRIR